jgi:hypothetical protein
LYWWLIYGWDKQENKMAALVTHDNAVPGTSVNLTNNVMEIGLGTKLSVDLGIINTAVFGGWNRLLACTSTYIQMGTRMDLNLAQAVSVAEGDSWLYSGSNNTTYDVASRWGVYLNLFAGGTSKAEKDSRWTEEKQSKMIRAMTMAAFIATVGISLVNILHPAFKSVSAPVDDGDAAPTVDPVTGETIYDTDKVSGYELNPGGIPVILLEIVGILGLFVCQLILASKMANNLKDFNAVANLSLAANGLTSAVFSDPDRQPRLFPQGTPMSDGTASPRDHYRKIKDDTYVVRSPDGKLHYYKTGETNPYGVGSDPGSSPVATFNMLPGMPIAGVNVNSEYRNTEYRDWENLKKGLYPPHDNKPVITLSTELEPYKKRSSSIDMIPNSMVLASVLGDRSELKEHDSGDIKQHLAFSGIFLQTGNAETGAETIIANSDMYGNGGTIVINDDATIITRNTGKSLDFAFVKASSENKKSSSPTGSSSGTIGYDSDESITPGTSGATYYEENNIGQSSLLKLEAGRAFLATDDGINMLAIDNNAVVIRSGNINVAKFFPDEIEFGGYTFNKAKGIELGVLVVKNEGSQNWPNELELSKFGEEIHDHVTETVSMTRDRIQTAIMHKSKTGGFSGSLNDDERKYSNHGMANEYYVDDNGQKYVKTKIGTFQSGITGVLKSLWPLPWYWWK